MAIASLSLVTESKLAPLPSHFRDTYHQLMREMGGDVAGYVSWVCDQLVAEPQADIEIESALVDGLYIRTMRVPAGVYVAGARHMKAGLSILSEGEISILTQNGEARLCAPQLHASAAGICRLGYTHTPVVWTTVHATTLTNLDDIEAELFSVDLEDIK